MAKIIIGATEVLLRETRYPKGTEFAVVDGPKDGQSPVQVDPETARRWVRDGWAIDKAAAASAAK